MNDAALTGPAGEVRTQAHIDAAIEAVKSIAEWKAARKAPLAAKEQPAAGPHDRAGSEFLRIHQRTLGYLYDDAGRLTTFTYSEGRVLHYDYDAAGRLNAVRLPDDRAIVFGYDAKSRLASLAYPNGVNPAWEYDAAGLPASAIYGDRASRSSAGGAARMTKPARFCG